VPDLERRRAVSGYDQRIEVLGSKGSTLAFAGAGGIVSDKPMPFFLERYAEPTGASSTILSLR